MSEDNEIETLAAQVGAALRERGLYLAAAESCTGGWVCQAVTDIAGSSAWFERGFVTYTNTAKQNMLGVPLAVLDEHGAVSKATVRAMVDGVLNHSPADCALAVSGIAGPTGATPGKPVGTVWFAWLRRGGDCVTRREQFDGDRRAVRKQAVAVALQGIIDLLDEPR
jgi:nicotinamide-nucleotide amidase